MNRRQLAKAATREKLIVAARAVWAEPGSYEAATIRVIAKAAGMSTGAIFANFKGKEDLWRAVMGYEPPVDSAEVRKLLRAMAGRKACAEAIAARAA
ncbi:AcrR family transcriptional regulator [Brevundimonas bullata]|uniref:AcrR family transcriptional regulator n=1 Tax=Brevundimonas bullata TaxID=13160 RepID=A0A7W7N5S8_9CAUL|nr:helix-turn-helix domain-containing protein [Brevundimonas bullata]MBB4799696.1 AcrR family transcriptional regulator [Brevundimonas bullata]MBB6384682.1 AcrR family transcriptional regulator [Brevundimonas bullata]